MHSFNWHEEEDNALQWLIPSLLAGGDDDLFDKVAKATEQFTNVQLKVSINGINVPVEHIAYQLEANVEHEARKIAKERLKAPEIQQVIELLESFGADVRQHLYKLADKAGIKLDHTNNGDEHV